MDNNFEDLFHRYGKNIIINNCQYLLIVEVLFHIEFEALGKIHDYLILDHTASHINTLEKIIMLYDGETAEDFNSKFVKDKLTSLNNEGIHIPKCTFNVYNVVGDIIFVYELFDCSDFKYEGEKLYFKYEDDKLVYINENYKK